MVALSKVVIAGGGIVGNSIAYFLAKTRPDISIVLVDPVGIAPGASSKAGGFLAKEWRDGTPLQSMQRLGFELHQDLADELGSDRIDYRRLTCHTVGVGRNSDSNDVHDMNDADADADADSSLPGVEWADLNVIGTVSMGDEDVIAQVHPRKLCEAMWEKVSQIPGSELRKGRIVKALTKEITRTRTDGADADNDAHSQIFSITGVELEDGSTIDADALIVACGPWTQEAQSWFPTGTNQLPEITSIKCHSMLVQPKSKKVFDQAVFFESYDRDLLLDTADLEVYPRSDGDCYVNGFQGEEGIINEKPGEEKVDDEDIELMKEAMRTTSSELGNVEPHTTQACYWPETPDGLPCIGPVHGVKGAFVAAGHGVWGILQGPVTGKAMAELLLDGTSTTLDLTAFDIQRFE